jgi:hypothetical protein
MIDFPANPTDGQVFQTPTITYQWDGAFWLAGPPNSAVADAPADGKQYGRQNAAWTEVVAGGITEPPLDSRMYGRKNRAWARSVDGTGDAMSGPLQLPTGAVNAPALTFTNSIELGLYWKNIDQIGIVAKGFERILFDLSDPFSTVQTIRPSGLDGTAKLLISNQPATAADAQHGEMIVNADGSVALRTAAIGADVRGSLTLDAPQILLPDGTVTAPGIAFASEPELGFYVPSPGGLALTSPAGVVGGWDTVSDNVHFSATSPVAGQCTIGVNNGPGPNNNFGFIRSTQTDIVIDQYSFGTATPLPLTVVGQVNVVLDTPSVLVECKATGTTSMAFNSLVPDGNTLLHWMRNGQSYWYIGAPDTAAMDNAWSISRRDIGTGGALDLPIRIPHSTGEVQTNALDSANYVNANITLGIGARGTPGALWRVTQESTIIRQYFNNDVAHRFDYDIATGIFTLSVSLGAYVFNNDGATAQKNVAGDWAALSDARIKDNVQDYTVGLDAILGLQPRTFTFKAGTGRAVGQRFTSLIAQEAEAAMPDLVSTAPGTLGDIELDDMRTLDTTNITYALINAVKTLNARLAALEGTP